MTARERQRLHAAAVAHDAAGFKLRTQLRKLRDNGASWQELADASGLPMTTIRRWVA